MTKKVVIIGGGTGTFPVIQAFKHLEADISTVITVSDSGGSTGRIRDEFGFQPVGDLRQSLAALAENEGQDWIRKILLYRFEKGTGLKGHNLGNLILTALQDMTKDTTAALEIAEKIFRLDGSVIPATRDNVQLQVNYEDGSSAIGEDILDQHADQPKRVRSVELVPEGRLNPLAVEALLAADVVVIGPGDYFGSLMAVLVAKGLPDVMKQVKAPILYIMNLMTRVTQTKDMTALEHVAGIEATIGRPVTHILLNTVPIAPTLLAAYAKENEFPVQDDVLDDARVMRRPLITNMVHKTVAVDTAHRSLLRHDRDCLVAVFQELLHA